MPKFPHYLQPDAMDCGPTCLRIVAKHFGRHYNLETLRNLTWKTREGVSLLTISDAAESIGFRSQGARLTIDKLSEIPLPLAPTIAVILFCGITRLISFKTRGDFGPS